METPKIKQEHYHALVDMGSNGIRFSISDLSPPTARIFPTIYQDRCDISLYDAQYDGDTKVPIPDSVIEELLTVLLRFRKICEDFGVPNGRIRIVATEATRTALNSDTLLQTIQSKLGMEVDLLSKEEEGRVGALGIASSFDRAEGLVMDLGGGSVQLNWLRLDNGETNISGSVSLPYGAAATTRRLAKVTSQADKDQLHHEVTSEITKAFATLELSNILEKRTNAGETLHIFLSGGGFRGWGYILMSRHSVQPYPIPIINGFSVDTHDFLPSNVAQLSEVDNSTFRISSRRASQVPAVSFLICALAEILSTFLDRSRIHFAQGGLREGLLFSLLSPAVKTLSPLVAATSPYAPVSAAELFHTLCSALPFDASAAPKEIYQPSIALLRSAINLLHFHASCPKDIRTSSALRCTTTGLLANAHGLSHEERAFLGLALFERWRGELPPTDQQYHAALQQILGLQSSFVATYVGRLLYGLGEIFPSGKVRPHDLEIRAFWETVEEGEGSPTQTLVTRFIADVSGVSIAERWAADLEKLGKRKHWMRSGDGRERWGFKTRCTVTPCDTSIGS